MGFFFFQFEERYSHKGKWRVSLPLSRTAGAPPQPDREALRRWPLLRVHCVVELQKKQRRKTASDEWHKFIVHHAHPFKSPLYNVTFARLARERPLVPATVSTFRRKREEGFLKGSAGKIWFIGRRNSDLEWLHIRAQRYVTPPPPELSSELRWP